MTNSLCSASLVWTGYARRSWRTSPLRRAARTVILASHRCSVSQSNDLDGLTSSINRRRCTIKIKLLGFSKFLYHCFLESVSLFTISNLLYIFAIISEFCLGAKIGDARLWEQKLV